MKHSIRKAIACLLLGVFITCSSVSAQTGTCTASALCVRSGPGLSYPCINFLWYGQQVPITYNCQNGWYEVYLNGGVGYVSAAYMYYGAASLGTYSGSTGTAASTYSAPAATTYSAPAATTQTTTNKTWLGTFKLTAYCSCAKCCGTANNLTASGVYPTAGHTVAMGGVPFGTKLLINGTVYTVEDRGTPYGTVDIYCSSHQEALNFGLQVADVYQIN